MTRALPLIALFLSLSACDGDDSALLVDLRTDYVPGLDFVTVEVSATPAGATTELPSSRTVSTRDSFLPVGSRVAEYRGIPAGTTSVRVRLRSRSGAFVGEGRVVVDIQGQNGVTVVISRSCMDIVCPLDDPGATACYGGRCVTPDCRPGDMTTCGEAECSADTECTPSASCGIGRCVDGVCFADRDDSACGAMEICDPATGCVGAPVEDAGMPDTSIPDAPTDARMPLDRATFLEQAREATCGISIACSNRGGIGALFLDIACHSRFTNVFAEVAVPWLRIGPGSGFDETAALACLAELEAYDDCIVPLPEVCLDAIPGTLPNGSPCGTQTECVSGICVSPAPECNVGTCVPAAGMGETCDAVSRCARGLFCAPGTGTCAGYADAGEECSTMACQRGLVCDGGSCRAGPVLGEACTIPIFGADPCVDGNRCSGGACVTPAAPGEACGPCPGGTRCDAGLCRLTTGPGGRCTADRDCPIFYHCEGDACTEDPILGDACGGDLGNCAEGVCSAGVCRLGVTGEACGAASSALRQCEGECSGGTCQDPLAAGATCVSTRLWTCGTDAYCMESDRCGVCP